MQNQGISLSPLKNVSSNISWGHEWKSVSSTPACGCILGKHNTNWQNSPRRGIATAACGIYSVCVHTLYTKYLYMYRSTYTEEWGRWIRRACLELGWLWNVLKFDTESKSRDLIRSFSPASCNDLWSNLPQARAPFNHLTLQYLV